MLAQEVLFACVMALVTPSSKVPQVCEQSQAAHAISGAILAHAGDDIPAEVVAGDMWTESTMRQEAVGALGEVGLMQLKRGGAVQGEDLNLTSAQLAVPYTNARIGIGYMRQMKASCKGGPARWLSRYNGRACGASIYSAHVLAAVAHGKNLLKRLFVRERKLTS